MSDSLSDHEGLYREVLSEYCRTHSEASLYRASLLSGRLIEMGLGPDEIVALHFEGVQAIAHDETLTHADRIRVLSDAHQFLLEVMIAYGAQYKEFLDLKLSEALRRAEEAEYGEREKLELLAMIAHELGNPLTVALGNMQLAARFLDAQDITNVRNLVNDSREALERLAGLTSQLLAASRGDGIPLQKEPVDLRHVVSRTQVLCRNLAREKRIEIEFQAGPSPVIVYGDQEALTTIAANLTSNAIRYTDRGGRVTLLTEAAGPEAVLAVSDTGMGIPPDALERIFEKFYRTESAREREPQGMGMGLSIVDRLVRIHGGRIEVQTHPGAGSTFKVILPAIEGQEEGEEDATGPSV